MPVLLETRKPRPGDAQAFKLLLASVHGGREGAESAFGPFEFSELLERYYFSLVAYDVDDPSLLRGMVTLSDTPTPGGGSADPRAYLDWVSHYCGMSGMPTMKTLFVKVALAEEKYEKDVVASLVEAVFEALPELETLVYSFAQKPGEVAPKGVKERFMELKRLPDTTAARNETFESYKVFVCQRASVLPRLAVRGACVEDYDDLMPIFNQQSEVLSATYGDFFLAEIIEAQDKENKAVVGVTGGKAQGFMALTSHVDLSVLHKCFALDAYDRLVKTDEQTGAEVSNAVAITLFCLDERWASRGRDFLPYAFDLFPQQEYILLTLPSTCTPLPLLSLFTLVRPLPASVLPHVLYVLHRDTLLAASHLRVSRYTSHSYYAAKKLFEDLPKDKDRVDSRLKATHEHEATSLADGPRSAAFVATIGTQVMALLVLESLSKNEVEQLQVTFAVESAVAYPSDLRLSELGRCRVLLTNPVVLPHAPFLLREAMRLAGKKALLYDTGVNEDVPPPVKAFMLPVRPRVNAIAPPPPAPSNNPDFVSLLPPPLTEVTGAQSLHALPLHRVSQPRRRVNSRVVVVGGGSSALAVLEGLLLDPEHCYTSITVIAPQGLRPHPDEEVLGLVPIDDDFPPPRHFHALGLQAGVRVLQTMLVSIDRQHQAVLLPRGKVLNYDVLVLASGLQDVTSSHLAALDYRDGRMELPANVFPPSRPQLCKGLRASVKGVAERSGSVVVYGGGEEALQCVQGLIDRHRVPPSLITLAVPQPAPPADGPSNQQGGLLCDVQLDRVVAEVLTDQLGVKVLWDVEMSGLLTDDDPPSSSAAESKQEAPCRVSAVTFTARISTQPAPATESPEAPTSQEDGAAGSGAGEAAGPQDEVAASFGLLQLDAVAPSSTEADEAVAAAMAAVDPATAAAASGEAAAPGAAGEGSEGAAAGPSRVVRIEVPADALFLCHKPDVDPFLFRAVNDSGLVYDGRLVVDQHFRTADPRILAGGPLCKFSRAFRKGAYHDKHSSREVGLHLAAAVRDQLAGVPVSERPALPPFTRAKSVTATLPGGLTYFSVHAVDVPPRPVKAEDDNTMLLTTGPCNAGLTAFGKFFAIRFSSLGRIVEISYLGKEELRGRTYIPLIGLQDSYLKSARDLHDLDRLDDWAAYLRDSWAGPLYHDGFYDMAVQLRALLQKDEGARLIVKNVLSALDDGKDDEVLLRSRKRTIGVGGAELMGRTRKLVEEEAVAMVRKYRGSMTQFWLTSDEEEGKVAVA